MRHAVALDGVHQSARDWLLPDQIGELLRPIAPCDHRVFDWFRAGGAERRFLFRHAVVNSLMPCSVLANRAE